MRSLGLAIVSGFVLILPAFGQVPAVQMSVQVDDQAPVAWPLPNGTPTGDAFSFQGARTDSVWGMTWDLDVKPDPWIAGLIAVTNTSTLLQTYTLTVSMPVSPTLASPTLSGGSVGASLTDNGDAFAQIAAVSGSSMYTGMIDGVGVLSLLPPTPASLTVLAAGQTVTASENAMPPSLVTGAVTTSIGIRYRFTLSPGDLAAFTGRFEVIPEPATLLLLTVGGFLLSRRGRRF